MSAQPAITRWGVRALALATVVIVLDQITKAWILFSVFPERCPGFSPRPSATPGADAFCTVPVVPPFFDLSMVWNRGVSFGLLQAEIDWVRWSLAAFSLVVSILLILWARQVTRAWLGLALGLVIGGAIGNLIDRVRFGAVADFLDFSDLYFLWVFNIADSAITVGVILLILDSLRPAQPKPGRDAPLRPESGVG